MNGPVRRGKPSLLEAGLPCASLSAECQRDNNARQRPPQNRLHIWWARRPPTVCRAAILGALLPFDLDLPETVLPATAPEPSEEDLDELPRKMQPHRAFFERLLKEVPATRLAKQHQQFLKALGVAGDSDRAYRRMAVREEYQVGSSPILYPWTGRTGMSRRLPLAQVKPCSRSSVRRLQAGLVYPTGRLSLRITWRGEAPSP